MKQENEIKAKQSFTTIFENPNYYEKALILPDNSPIATTRNVIDWRIRQATMGIPGQEHYIFDEIVGNVKYPALGFYKTSNNRIFQAPRFEMLDSEDFLDAAYDVMLTLYKFMPGDKELGPRYNLPGGSAVQDMFYNSKSSPIVFVARHFLQEDDSPRLIEWIAKKITKVKKDTVNVADLDKSTDVKYKIY